MVLQLVIVLPETKSCKNSLKAKREERIHIEQLKATLNCSIPSRSPPEYREDNKEQTSSRDQKYREQNKEQLVIKQKEYREQHREQTEILQKNIENKTENKF